MRRPAWRRRRAALLAVALLAGGLGVLAYATHLLRRPEQQSVDVRFAIRGSQPHRLARIVVVAIDDQTFSDFNNRGVHAQWPFPRRYHARVIDALRRAGAEVIAFDVQFTEATDEANDNALIEAVGRGRSVVLATTVVGPHGSTNVLGGDALLRQLGARPANTNLVPDSDGELRSMRYSMDGLRTFGVVVTEADTGRRVPPSLFGGVSHPVPIDYAGPPGTVPTISYSRIFEGRFAPAQVAGKIVIVGPTASSLQDLHQTPTSGRAPMSGPEVLANTTATVLDRVPLHEAPAWVDVLLIVLLGCAAPLSSMRLPALRSLLGSLALGLVTVVLVQVSFNRGWIVAFTYPLAALLLAALGTLAVIYLSEAFERQRLRAMFARFVPAEVVDEVVARTDGNLRLGALERDCTVLFCDLRGFTSFSEAQPPARVIDAVNFYVNEMTEAILDAGGTLITYMGDGIMALFGAPLEQPDHAERALAAAREMMGPRLECFNAWLAERGYVQPFRMGIGLNSGPVLAGNLGSDHRLQYTAIGDTVNTAARLEGMTKDSGHQLFISESTLDFLTRSRSDLVFVDELEVRGRKGKVRVWAMAASGSEFR